MAKTKSANISVAWLQSSLLRITRIHFLYVAAYAVSIIIFDSWNLIPSDVVLQRWTIAAMLFAINAIVWYAARSQVSSLTYYKVLLLLLIILDIVLAAVTVYTERGMASRAVMLFVVPLLIVSTLKSRVALFSTAAVCVAAYVIAVIGYFTHHFGEGYKVELYGVTALYSAVLFIVAALLNVLINSKD